MIVRDIRVEYSKRPDYLAARVRKHRIFDAVSLSKALQDITRVVSYRRRVDSMSLERVKRELQLDELITAIRSPIGAAAECQQETVGSRQVIQCSGLTLLIGQGELRHFLSDRGSGSVAVVLCLDKVKPVVDRDVRAACAKPADHPVQDRGFGCSIHDSVPLSGRSTGESTPVRANGSA